MEDNLTWKKTFDRKRPLTMCAICVTCVLHVCYSMCYAFITCVVQYVLQCVLHVCYSVYYSVCVTVFI